MSSNYNAQNEEEGDESKFAKRDWRLGFLNEGMTVAAGAGAAQDTARRECPLGGGSPVRPPPV